VNFHASPSSATLAFATGSKIRSIHFHGHNAKNRHSTVIIPGKGVLKPIIERDMDTVRALGIHVPAGRLPAISLHGWEIEQADQRISKLNLPAPLLGIGLGATRPVKTWPIERFAALALEWCRKTGGGVLAVAGPNENDKAHAFLKSVDDALGESVRAATERTSLRARISAESNLPIRALAAILSRMSVFAGNDSGPRHVALATGTPTVTLFGPEHPFEWHPYPEDTHPLFFFEALACRSDAAPGMPAWCGLHECVAEEHKCMRMIGVNQVLQQCERVARPLILTR
jgi:ADP-heptose:LPS heptosyltransferase